MTPNVFIASLRKNLAPAAQQYADEVEGDPRMQAFLKETGQKLLIKRKALAAELAAAPARHVKAIKAAVAERGAADEALRLVEAAIAPARVRAQSAHGAVYGLENQARLEVDRLERELREGAHPLVTAAWRGLWAFSPDRFAPDLMRAPLPKYISPYDLKGEHDFSAVLEAAQTINGAAHLVLLRAAEQLRAATGQLDAMMLQALSDEDVVERVTEILGGVNTALAALKNTPHFVLDEHLDVALKFGHDEVAYKVKPADIGAVEGVTK